jgi:phage-related protein (TIGR01555 family)
MSPTPAPLAALKTAASNPDNLVRLAQFARRLDGWQNAFTGLGTSRDKREATAIGATTKIPFEVLRDMYRSDFLTARIVDKPAAEMCREWIEVRIQDQKEAGEACDQWLDDLDARAAFELALQWRRGYGGAGILLGINRDNPPTPEQMAAPLNPGDIRTIDHLTVFSARELQTVAYYSDPLSPKFGQPAVYRIVPQVPFGISGQAIMSFGATMLDPVMAGAPTHPWSILPEVHESWILRFDGAVVDRRQRLENWGWGDAVLQRCYDIIRDVGSSWGSIANLLQDFAQGIFSMPGLMDALASDNEGLIQKRLELLDLTRSNQRMIALDGGREDGGGKEEFKREVATLTGAAEVLNSMFQLLSAAADQPLTMLLGQSPKGLGNEGESDMERWRDHVADLQRSDMLPQLKRLIELGMTATKGPTGGKVYTEPTEGRNGKKSGRRPWSIYFRPLRQLDEQEQATLRKTIAETDQINIAQGIYTPEEARTSHYGGDGFSVEVQLDHETREAFETTDPAEGAGMCPDCGVPCEPGKPCPKCGAVAPEAPAAPPPGTLEQEGEEMPATGAPAKPGESATAPGGADLQALALNGAQITGMVAILAAVRDGSLPPESAIVALQVSFPAQIDAEKARKLVTPIEVKEPPAPPDPLELAKARAAGAPPPPGAPGKAPPFGKPVAGDKPVGGEPKP